MRANQLRLWFSSVAYLMMSTLRRLALKGTERAKAQCGTIRFKPFKIGARTSIEAPPFSFVSAIESRQIPTTSTKVRSTSVSRFRRANPDQRSPKSPPSSPP
jgi:hypothetical protein